MAGIQGKSSSSNISNNYFDMLNNGTGLTGKIYVFTPAGSSTKLTLLISLVVIGIVALVGNILILCFLKKKKRANNILKMFPLEQNFKLYIQSLAMSDILSAVISLPAVCIQVYFDLFQHDWGCRIARYLNFVFVKVTMNNLLVISIEKYLSTRKPPRTFRHSTVKKLVFIAWLAGFFLVSIPAATFKGTKYDLNDTHYTVVCKNDNEYLPFRIMFVSYKILAYILPSILIIRLSVSLIITVLSRMRRAVDVQRDNGIRLARRAAGIRSTCIIITIMLAYIIPYIFYITYGMYNMVTKAHIDFQTDFTIRSVSGVIGLSNSAINVIIYLVQMKDFRSFLKRQFISRVFGKHVNQVAMGPA
ncbi:adenosine receptor A3-like [Oculina patagonica]